jgi:hypothetical protein
MALTKVSDALLASTTFAPTAHTHTIANVTSLQTSLDAKAPLASPSFTGNVTVAGELKITESGTHIVLDTLAANQNNWITWKDNGTGKWEVNKDTLNNFNIYSYGVSANVVQLNPSGNMGLGVTPESWNSGWSSLQVGGAGSIYSHTTSAANTTLGHNIYRNANGNEAYLFTDEASRLSQQNGTHQFQVAASGTADGAISWTTGMSVLNTGHVQIGESPETYSWLNVRSSTRGISSISTSVDDTAGSFTNSSMTTARGGCITAYSNSSSVGTFSLVKIKNDNASAVNATCLEVINDSTGPDIHITSSTPQIRFQYPGNSGYAHIKSDNNSALMFSTGTTTGTTRLQITYDGRGLSQFTAKAWCNFNQNTHTIMDSHNISSVSDSGVGNSRVNFSNNLANANYVAIGSAAPKGGSHNDNIAVAYDSFQSVSTMGWLTYRASTNQTFDADRHFSVYFGD